MAKFDKDWIQFGSWKQPINPDHEVWHAILILQGFFADGLSHTGSWWASAVINKTIKLSMDEQLEDVRKCKEDNATKMLINMVREPIEKGLFPSF